MNKNKNSPTREQQRLLVEKYKVALANNVREELTEKEVRQIAMAKVYLPKLSPRQRQARGVR